MKPYPYITLAELDRLSNTADENLKVNIYAFVANLKVRSQSVDTLEDGDIRTELELSDGSTDTYAACIIYSNSLESFSDQLQITQIIRMHRAKIKKTPNGKLFIYGKLRIAGFAVLLFSGQLGDSFDPLYQSSAKFTLPSDHKERITSLRNVFMTVRPMIMEDPPTTSDGAGISDDHLIATTTMSPVNQIATYANKEETNEIIKNANIRRLNELVPRNYGDICVQAIALFMGDRNNVILRCWDTTSPPRKLFMLSNDCIHEVICRDGKLEMTAAGCWCDIVLYEEHGDFARNNVKCGDILLLINVHLYHSKHDVALTMHGGRCFKRSIVILDDNNKLKHYLLRTIDEFNANKVSLCSNIQADVGNERSIEDVQEHTCMDIEQIASTQPLDEMNDLTEQQLELWKCWASERMRQIHAVQLSWIYSYAWKKKQQTNLELQRSFNLAKMAVKFTIRQILQRLFVYNKDLFTNLAKLSLQQRNTLFMNSLLTYMEGAYGDGLISKLKDGHKRSDDSSKQMKISKVRKDESSKDDIVQSLLWNLSPGTVLKLSGWQVNFSYNANAKIIFALICNRCNLWCTTSAKNFDITPLCPVCFKRDIYDSYLFLQCYFIFNGIPQEMGTGSKKHYFLFPIQLLASFLVDVPENAQEAARNYRRGISDNQRKTLAASIQKQMLSDYIFMLDEVIVRKMKADIAILEVGKLTFLDR